MENNDFGLSRQDIHNKFDSLEEGNIKSTENLISEIKKVTENLISYFDKKLTSFENGLEQLALKIF